MGVREVDPRPCLVWSAQSLPGRSPRPACGGRASAQGRGPARGCSGRRGSGGSGGARLGSGAARRGASSSGGAARGRGSGRRGSSGCGGAALGCVSADGRPTGRQAACATISTLGRGPTSHRDASGPALNRARGSALGRGPRRGSSAVGRATGPHAARGHAPALNRAGGSGGAASRERGPSLPRTSPCRKTAACVAASRGIGRRSRITGRPSAVALLRTTSSAGTPIHAAR